MTQEEKARRYDEAIKVIKDNLYALNEITETGAEVVNIQSIKNCFYKAFPELKEFENERIRNWLIGYFHQYKDDGMEKYANGLKVESILAWLEKQGDQKSINELTPQEAMDVAVAKCFKKFEQNLANEMVSAEESLGISSEEYNKIVDDCIFGENEPKFKVGDWIISTLPGIKYPHLITDIRDGYYIFGEDDDYAYIASNDNILKLWTIQDAKDGDVLVDRFSKDNIIILYKGINPKLSVLAYCGWNGYNLSIKTNGLGYGNLDNTNYYPATKEQRDTLFTKMKEAGYEWDSENKQLLSLKAEPSNEQKSTWSEEDNKWIESLIQTFEDGYFEGFNQLKSYGVISWLKSLKQKIGG